MKFFKSKITIAILSVILVIVVCAVTGSLTKERIRTVGSYSKLESLYSRGEYDEIYNIMGVFLKPSNIFTRIMYRTVDSIGSVGATIDGSTVNSFTSSGSTIKVPSTTTGSSELEAGKDYSTTNVQVENVDEADIIKTDGKYVYSLSGQDIVITNVEDPENPVVESRISSTSSTSAPDEFMVQGNKLIAISKKYSGRYGKNTLIEIYNTADKTKPIKEKSYFVDYEYYSSRIADGKLYVISTGYMFKDSDKKFVDYYEEDYEKKSIGFKNMYYFKDRPSTYMTTVSSIDLEKPGAEFEVKAYLTDVDNIYVSDKNIYLIDEEYENDVSLLNVIGKIFGIKGIWSLVDEDIDLYGGKATTILKIQMNDDATVNYKARKTLKGSVINQFSFDEYNSNLRVAIKDNKGSRIVVLNDKLKVLGQTDPVEKDENMYSSRFMGDRAYLVTYRTIDPLFVFDLSDPKNPKVMGELKIPGYSTYLHPYDENHIIGIGFQTEETVSRSSSGKVMSVRAVITGMKMSLFDVSDIKNPVQISEVEIGDASTKSAVLTNHKALLFSKERGLIAIPVTSYSAKTTLEKTYYSELEIDDLVKDYSASLTPTYVSEGYLVYDMSIENGFKLRGVITHGLDETTRKYNYSGSLLRGVYIKDNLFTVSQSMMKVNKLDTLEEVSKLEI